MKTILAEIRTTINSTESIRIIELELTKMNGEDIVIVRHIEDGKTISKEIYKVRDSNS